MSSAGTYGSESSEAIPTILIIDADAPTRDAHVQIHERPGRVGQAASAPTAPVAPRPAAIAPVVRGTRVRIFDFVLLRHRRPRDRPGRGNDDLNTLESLISLPHIELLPPSALPQRWLDFTCFDMIFISAADLDTLVAQHGPAWQAVRDWLATGPTLCVYDMELSQEKLSRLETLLGFSAPAEDDQPEAIRPGWRRTNLSKASSDTVAALDNWLRTATKGDLQPPRQRPVTGAENTAANCPPRRNVRRSWSTT